MTENKVATTPAKAEAGSSESAGDSPLPRVRATTNGATKKRNKPSSMQEALLHPLGPRSREELVIFYTNTPVVCTSILEYKVEGV